ncbi:MAG: transcriptional regulator [Chloroflexi bacterium]|nr:transcriptional regulator [Chloroflexota bacterium]
MVARRVPATTLSLRKIRADLGLSRERMGRLLDVSAKTIERWEERDTLPASSLLTARLSKIQEVAQLGLTVYTAEGFARFLATPMAELRGRTALQLMAAGEFEPVLAALAADYEGLGY